MVVLYAYKTYLNTDLHGDKFEKHLFSFSTLKWHPFPDGRESRLRACVLDYIGLLKLHCKSL